jgi:hypothetical protein
MATPAQIAANRLNAQKSSGPKSPAGLAVSRFNALKSGLDAKSQVIPGEDPAELAALAENYRRQFQPATPFEIFLVDALVTADWRLRRFRKLEPLLWCEDALFDPDSPEARGLTRLYQRLDAAERSFYRALKELQRQIAARAEAELAALSQPDTAIAHESPFFPPQEIGFVSPLLEQPLPSAAPVPSPRPQAPASASLGNPALRL